MLRNARSACLEASGHKTEFFSSLLKRVICVRRPSPPAAKGPDSLASKANAGFMSKILYKFKTNEID